MARSRLVSIVGARSLARKLARMPVAARAAAEVGAGDVCRRIAAEARARVPSASGRLRSTIRVEDETRGAAVVAGDESVDYADDVEYGGDPFLRPAVESVRNDAAKLAGRPIGRALDRFTE